MDLNNLVSDVIEIQQTMVPEMNPSISISKTAEGRFWYQASDGLRQADGTMWHCYGGDLGYVVKILKEHLKNARHSAIVCVASVGS